MSEKVYGNIHSIESFGTVDGPGIRLVVFMQGCPMSCLYCHNPDTWTFNKNTQMSVNEILNKYESLKEFLKNGGITLTGGEPLCQIDFVTELFKKAKEKEIHTALDTCGILYEKNNTAKFDELVKYTDLVLLDIKHIDDEEHKYLTGHSNKNVLDFAEYLSEKNVPVWIRHVIVPSLTDKDEYLIKLGNFLKTLKNIKALDILPYHNMALPKYENLGIEYKLKDISPATKEQAIKARDIILSVLKNQTFRQ